MDAVEKAIRNALDRGDAGDASFRAKVYRSAHSALERSLSARPDLTVEKAIQRRRHLQATIDNIESEFAPAAEAPAALPVRGEQPRGGDERFPRRPAEHATPPSAPVPPVTAPPPAGTPEPMVRREPVLPAAPEVDDLDSLLTEDDLALDDEVAPEPRLAAVGPEIEAPVGEGRVYVPPPRRRSRRPTRFLVGLLVVAAVVAIGWWLVSDAGLLGASPSSETPLAGTAAGGDEEEGWITVFSPADPTQAVASGGAQASVVKQGNDTVLKISSQGTETPVAFKVGQGILEKLAGKDVVFDIVARAENGQKTQVSVSCDFGPLGDCGRSRFEVGSAVSDNLVRAPMKSARPAGEGTIAIVPDVSGGGKALEIIRIRASTGGGG